MPATIVLSAYPGRCTPGGHELALSIGVAVPQRRVEVTDLVRLAGPGSTAPSLRRGVLQAVDRRPWQSGVDHDDVDGNHAQQPRSAPWR